MNNPSLKKHSSKKKVCEYIQFSNKKILLKTDITPFHIIYRKIYVVNCEFTLIKLTNAQEVNILTLREQRHFSQKN